MKLLYNVTIKIDAEIHSEWKEWMCTIHIPDVMATGCFEAYKLTRIIDDEDEHGVGFAIQYVALSEDTFRLYQENFALALQKEHSDRYQGRYVAFRTLMAIEHEG
ncbi:MAG: DUF4286 family protein [Chitinophagales bacterium]|nr:DUF4286 family protein [Chitinophagales bacterium]